MASSSLCGTTTFLQCADNSLYVGETDDVAHRVEDHSRGRGGGHTAKHRPVQLAYIEPTGGASLRGVNIQGAYKSYGVAGSTPAPSLCAAADGSAAVPGAWPCDFDGRRDSRRVAPTVNEISETTSDSSTTLWRTLRLEAPTTACILRSNRCRS